MLLTRGRAITGKWPVVAPLVLVSAFFVATRIILLLFTVRERFFVLPSVTNDVKYIYTQWYYVLSHGRFPHHDVMWQYPPAAALVILAPALLPLSYAVSFYWISFFFDLLAFAVLVGACRPRRNVGTALGWRAMVDRRNQPWAAWVWTLGVALGGPIAYGRYDLITTSIAICGLVLVAGRRPDGRWPLLRRVAAGALISLGALLKVWPALLLLPIGPLRKARAVWASAVLTVAGVLFAFWLTMPDALSFVSAQGGRGIEIESLGALPFHIAIHHGWSGRVALNYGSMEYLGPHVHLVTQLSLVASVLAMGWLVLWRVSVRTWRASTVADASLVATLLFVVTSRVISPQYMVWLVGLGAVCAVHWRGEPSQAGRENTVMRLPICLILAATALSCLEFPYWFDELMASQRNAVLLVTLRNVLLVAAAVIGATRLWRSTRVTELTAEAGAVHLPMQRVPVGADGGQDARHPS
ncbi:MAG TPA: glycosyltransferase family 87 protein [Sporichthyaceae bacterium]|nr:glycosyltransferase family 87 protein [Sporichthyaceae bacterium]